MSYLIRITDHINKSDRVIHRLTTIESSNKDFYSIINHLNKNNEFLSRVSNGVAELTKNDEVTVPGYFYNSTKTVTKLAYTLNLIKIDEELSQVFPAESRESSESTHTQTQTENSSDLQTKETQSESSNQNKSSQVYNDVDSLTKQYEDTDFFKDDEEFGEFQNYTPEFVNVNEPDYSYYGMPNVIIPSYQPSYQPSCQSSNPFQSIMSLRGDNDDVHFTFGSQVPRTPTQVVTNWAPELVHELKFRLTQPNAGLSSTNSNINYFL